MLLLLWGTTAQAAISRNGKAALGLENPAPGGTYSANYTVTSGSTLIWVGCFGSNGDTWTTPTYNGTAMTKLGPVDDTSDRPVVAFYLFSPTSGTHAFSVSGLAGAASCNASDYAGVSTSAIDSSNTGNNPAASITVSTTVVAANSWVMVAQRENTGGATTWTNATLLNEPGDGMHTADSNGPVASGSYSVTAANSGATQEKLIVASFAPSGGAPPSCAPTMTLLGVGRCGDLP